MSIQSRRVLAILVGATLVLIAAVVVVAAVADDRGDNKCSCADLNPTPGS